MSVRIVFHSYRKERGGIPSTPLYIVVCLACPLYLEGPTELMRADVIGKAHDAKHTHQTPTRPATSPDAGRVGAPPSIPRRSNTRGKEQQLPSADQRGSAA